MKGVNKMNTNMKLIAANYEINSKLLLNSFKDVDDSLSNKRPNKKTNSMLFITLHLIDSRYFILTQLGGKVKNPFREYMDWSKSIEEVKSFPLKDEVLKEWAILGKKLLKKLAALDAKSLNAKIEMQFPGGNSILNMISFLSEHEAYHVGQIGFIRKFHGLPAVEY